MAVALSHPGASADPTLAFMAALADKSKWVIKRRVPIFKAHDRFKLNPKTGEKFVAYTVTDADLYAIAENMREAEERGEPARLTVGHVTPGEPETQQPKVIGYWLNARVEAFGPSNELGIIADAYLKRETAIEAKGRPYRSAEYYHGTKELTGAVVTTSDPALKLGTVELYRVPKRCDFYTAPVQCDLYEGSAMADEKEEKKEGEEKPERIGMKPADEKEATGEPEGHPEWAAHMEHYASKNPWVGYAMHCYTENAGGAGMPGATNEQIPATPAAPAKEEEMNRMSRDDHAVAYARLETRLKQLEESNATLSKERDEAVCERMVRQLQAEGYTLRDDTPTLVKKLVAKSPADRDEMIQLIRDYSPKGAPQGPMLEVYSGHAEDDPAKFKPATPAREQVADLAKRFAGDPAGFEKELAALRNGTGTKN